MPDDKLKNGYTKMEHEFEKDIVYKIILGKNVFLGKITQYDNEHITLLTGKNKQYVIKIKETTLIQPTDLEFKFFDDGD